MGTIEYVASKVTFLATNVLRGNVNVAGPETGIQYVIAPYGTPVSNYDLTGLLKVTGPPCCGAVLPFGGEVKLFGMITPTREQLLSVPNTVVDAEPKHVKGAVSKPVEVVKEPIKGKSKEVDTVVTQKDLEE